MANHALPAYLPCTPVLDQRTRSHYPQMRMCCYHDLGEVNELLRIEMTNPWSNLLFRNVTVAFLATDPNLSGKDEHSAMTFIPTKNIGFGDIAPASLGKEPPTVVRNILLLGAGETVCQFYAGVCFEVLSPGQSDSRNGYMLFRSGYLPKVLFRQ
jgi:hypothetical protein